MSAVALRVRRVLVATDASPASLAAAESAARLASSLEAELVGLFVEDHALLRLSESPLAHQVDLFTASVAPLRGADVRRQLNAQAARARASLSRSAARRGVAWSFRVVRGSVAAEIVAAAGEADIVSLGHLARSAVRRGRLGSIARALLGQARRRTLLSAREVDTRRPVAVVYDSGESAREALLLASRLGGVSDGRLAVLALEKDLPAARKELAEVLEGSSVRAGFATLGAASAAAIAEAVRREGVGLLVVPVSGGEASGEGIQELLSEIDCPVLAVS